MYQLIVLLAVANTTQGVPNMVEPPVKVVTLPDNTGTYIELSKRIAECTIMS